jgi:hypothetical protein
MHEHTVTCFSVITVKSSRDVKYMLFITEKYFTDELKSESAVKCASLVAVKHNVPWNMPQQTLCNIKCCEMYLSEHYKI